MLCERLVIHQVMTYLLPSFVLKTACKCSLISKRHYYSQTLLQKRSCIGWPNLITSTTRVSKFDSFIHIAYDSINPDTNIDLKTCSPLLLGLGGSVGLSVLSYLKWSLFPSFKSLSFEKLFFVEYLSFRDEGIQTILLLGYRFCSWFTGSYCFCLVLSWKRRESNVGRHWY